MEISFEDAKKLLRQVKNLEAENAQLREALEKALRLYHEDIDPSSHFEEWLEHMKRIGYPEFKQALAAGMTAGEQHLAIKEMRENMGEQDNG